MLLPFDNPWCHKVSHFLFVQFSHIVWIHYLLSNGESYGPTAQHLQDCLIFFIQLNYVHKTKPNKVLPPYVKLPMIPLPLLLSQLSHIAYCSFGNSCLYLLKSPFNTCHPSIIFVGLTWCVFICMHLGIL